MPQKWKYGSIKKGRCMVMEKENREHKDSVFVDLFYEDETAKKNLLSLYNALHDTEYQDENEQLIDKKARYRTTLVKIPTPEFYTFYNGKEDFPLEQELLLSDAFENPTGENSVELKVKVININSGKAHGLLRKCGILREYSQFIDTVRKYSGEEDSIKRAINDCIKQGILADYLKRKGSEVRNMLIAEYSYEEDMQVKQQEAIVLSAQIFQTVKRQNDITDEQIAQEVGCTVTEVRNVRRIFNI